MAKKSPTKTALKPGVVIYQAKNGAIQLRGDTARETVWATQAQISKVFSVERSVITKHINNLLKNNEIDPKSNVQKMHIANSDKPVALYSLDVILAVGYRTNSRIAVAFRKWATKTLREHITRGYTINRSRIGQNYDALLAEVNSLQQLLPEHVALDPKLVLELVKEFASTWVSLDAYDKDALTSIGTTKRAVKLVGADLTDAIARFREEILVQGDATELFARERSQGSVAGIVGNVMQSFGGKELYPSVEEKAANLLYFVVKNHPFSDGNKRSGAFSFVWFLRRARSKKARNINPAALTALTLLIAESDPKKKEQLVALVTRMLA
jgi:hypothetical protein